VTDHQALDLDAIDACPLDEQCENCGRCDDLDVATAGTPVGVYCFTLCGTCTDAGSVPEPGGWSRAVVHVLEHCEHLGFDLDQMAAQLKQDCFE